MRREEVANLTRADVQDGHAREALITGKGSKERLVFFDDQALAAIRAYLEARADRLPPLFLRHDLGRGRQAGPGGRRWRLSPKGVWDVVKRYAAVVGVEATTHDFRHAKASVMLNRGAKLSEVQDILGHASPETTKKIYAHYEVSHLRDVFDRYSATAEELADSLDDAEARSEAVRSPCQNAISTGQPYGRIPARTASGCKSAVQSQRTFPGITNIVITTIVAMLAFGMAFVSGYLFGRSEPANGPLAFLDVLQPSTARATEEGVLSSEEQQRFKVFWETWQIVERDFYDKTQVDHQKLIYGAIKGMVDAVGDPYTVYQTPAQREVSDTDLRGSFDGIGIQVDMKDNRLTVVAPIEGSPAEAAGFRPGDVVLEVDGKSLAGKTLNDTVGLIRGQRGTPVTLTVLRQGTNDPIQITVERAEIKLKSVRVRMLDDQVGYLRISSFSASTGSEMANAVKSLIDQQARGIVVDLRNNPGGYLSTSVEAAAQFVDPGTVVLYQQSGNGDRKTYRTEGGGTASQLPSPCS